jgi:hypothetical protein
MSENAGLGKQKIELSRPLRRLPAFPPIPKHKSAHRATAVWLKRRTGTLEKQLHNNIIECTIKLLPDCYQRDKQIFLRVIVPCGVGGGGGEGEGGEENT